MTRSLNRYGMWEKELDRKIEKKTVTEEKLKKYRKAFRLRYDANGYFLNYQRNSEYIREELQGRGFFFIATSEQMSAEKALEIYRGRDNIEKMFMSLKSGIDFTKARVYDDASLRSKVMITFIAMIVCNEIFQRTKEIRKGLTCNLLTLALSCKSFRYASENIQCCYLANIKVTFRFL